MTNVRLVLAVVSTAMEEVAIVLIWRWVLPRFAIEIPVPVLVAVMVAWAAFSAGLFVFTTRVLKKKALAGLSSMVGVRGRVVGSLAPEGFVKIGRELWKAVSTEESLKDGDKVEVVRENGLTLVVRKVSPEQSKH